MVAHFRLLQRYILRYFLQFSCGWLYSSLLIIMFVIWTVFPDFGLKVSQKSIIDCDLICKHCRLNICWCFCWDCQIRMRSKSLEQSDDETSRLVWTWLLVIHLQFAVEEDWPEGWLQCDYCGLWDWWDLPWEKAHRPGCQVSLRYSANICFGKKLIDLGIR